MVCVCGKLGEVHRKGGCSVVNLAHRFSFSLPCPFSPLSLSVSSPPSILMPSTSSFFYSGDGPKAMEEEKARATDGPEVSVGDVGDSQGAGAGPALNSIVTASLNVHGSCSVRTLIFMREGAHPPPPPCC